MICSMKEQEQGVSDSERFQISAASKRLSKSQVISNNNDDEAWLGLGNL